MIKPAIIFTMARFGGAIDANAYMLSFMINAYLMERKVNPFLRLDYGITNDIGAGVGGPTIAKKDMNLFAGIGYHFNKHIAVDFAFIWNRINAPAAGQVKNSYTLGPFAEARF